MDDPTIRAVARDIAGLLAGATPDNGPSNDVRCLAVDMPIRSAT